MPTLRTKLAGEVVPIGAPGGATDPTMGGDLTGTASAAQIAAGAIVNADVGAAAAIALSKLATDPLARANHTGTQLAATVSDFAAAASGASAAGAATVGGDLTGTVANAQIAAGAILDADVNASAAIAFSKLAAPIAAVSMGSQRITSLADPSVAQDGATKAYVDSVATGLDVKQSVRVATTANITLSGTQTIDGVSVVATDRVLVKDQTTGAENGIYVCAAGAWSRATDADISAEVNAGMFTFTEAGTANGDKGWVLSTNNPITLGTTALVFSQFSGVGGDPTMGGDLSGTASNAQIVASAVGTTELAALAVTDAKVATANKDGAAGTASMRTLGTGATQAAAGNHTQASSTITDLTETVQDLVGAMVAGNTETGITVTYQDADGTLDFEVTGGAGSDETYQDHGNAGSTETISYSTARTHRIVLDSATCTLTFSGWPASGSKGAVELIVVHDATTSTRAITWPAAAKFANGIAPFMPTTTANAISRLVVTTVDGGTTLWTDLVGNDYA